MVDCFKNMMLHSPSESVELPEAMEELQALQGVKKYPVRIKCALLPWNTLLEGIKNVNGANKNAKTKYEET
jgi:nitrogen fixation NifU-like protein